MTRATLLGLTLLGAAAGAGGMWLANRVAPGDLSGADRTRIERVVREYVLAHPEILPEAMDRLQQRESAKAVSASRGAIEQPYESAWIGNPNADVTLVEFYDYNCGYCRAALPTIEKLVAEDKNLRIVFRELPVLAPSSRTAARAALAAAKQGRFKAFHDVLYAAGPVSDATIAAAAQRTGVNLATLPADADDELADNFRLAEKLGITGTPTWVVGDQMMTGALSVDKLKDAIAAARAR